MTSRILTLCLASASAALAGPYPPAAGQPGSTAISKGDARFVAWASGYWTPQYGTDVDAQWKTPVKALGKATSDVYDIVCLGNGGKITLHFPHPIRNGEGADFAVFENSFSANFLELAYVEVSSDGVNFFRFPCASLTASAVGGFGSVDPTNLDGLAGKYAGGWGTPFDLSALAPSPLLDTGNVRFVRIVDIIGNGTAKDSTNRPIYDPTPTVGSGGFDLDAIGVIHQNNGNFRMLASTISGGHAVLRWETNPGGMYRVETSVDLVEWLRLEDLPAPQAAAFLEKSYAYGAGGSRFWRVVRISP